MGNHPQEFAGTIRRNDIFRIVVIDSRALERECFVRGLELSQSDVSVMPYESAQAWIDAVPESTPDAVFYNTEGRRVGDEGVSADIAALVTASSIPVVVLSPHEDLFEMIAVCEQGAVGYVPASLGIDATLLALRLSTCGAIVLPAKSLLAARDSVSRPSEPEHQTSFTSRQAAIAELLRRGKPNKLIAYELNLCESTVKVHIRTIMKKLHARNRTEAGYKLNSMLAGCSGQPEQREMLQKRLEA